MFATPETQLYKNQYDALFESTEKNPYLTASTRASKNKALKTVDKRIIAAINEVKAKTDSLNSTVNTTLVNQNTKIGPLDSDPDLYNEFQNAGYKSLADGIVKVSKKVGDASKNTVFFFQKVNSSTIFPEIFIPFDMHILNVTARFSEADNDKSQFTDDIIIQLQHTDKAAPTGFTTFKTVTIPVTNNTADSFVSEDFEQDLPSGIMKARVTQFPDGLKNLNIVVTVTKINLLKEND
jgi:hypothetical protein